MRVPPAPVEGQAARTPDVEKSGPDTAIYSIPAPFPQLLAERGWSVAPISARAVKLTSRNGSVLIAGRHRRCRADTLERVAAADRFAARRCRP